MTNIQDSGFKAWTRKVNRILADRYDLWDEDLYDYDPDYYGIFEDGWNEYDAASILVQELGIR